MEQNQTESILNSVATNDTSSISTEMFNTGSTFLLRGHNEGVTLISSEDDKYPILQQMENTIDEESPVKLLSIPDYLESLSNLFDNSDKDNTHGILFMRTADIDLNKDCLRNDTNRIEYVSIKDAIKDIRTNVTLKKGSEKAKVFISHISAYRETALKATIDFKVDELMDSGLRWFTTYFDNTFKLSMESGKVTSNSKKCTTVFDYLQKDLKFSFKDLSYIAGRTEVQNDIGGRSTNISSYPNIAEALSNDFLNKSQATIKVSPVRFVAFDYKLELANNTHVIKRVREYVGSHMYNNMVTLISGVQVENTNEVFYNYDFPIIGYNLEFFYTSPNHNYAPIQMTGSMVKEILQYMSKYKNWDLDSLKVSLNKDIYYLISKLVSDGYIKDLGSSLRISMVQRKDIFEQNFTKGLKDYIYLARESHDISLINDDPDKDVPNYFNMIQKYYRDLLKVEENKNTASIVEHAKNYMSAFVLANLSGYDDHPTLVDRIGIYLPNHIASTQVGQQDETSQEWMYNIGQIDLALDLYAESTEDSPVVETILNRELLMNYKVGGYVPMFIFDVENKHGDIFHKVKESIIRYILSGVQSQTEQGFLFKDFDYEVETRVKNKPLAFSKEMLIPKCFAIKTSGSKDRNNERHIVEYNPDNTKDKDFINKYNTRVDDLDLLGDFSILSVDRVNNYTLCNISVNCFIADAIRLKMNENWGKETEVQPLPTLIYKNIKAKNDSTTTIHPNN